MIQLEPSGRFPGSLPCHTKRLSIKVERIDDDVVVRCDSDQYPEFWIEGRCRLTDLLHALLDEEKSHE